MKSLTFFAHFSCIYYLTRKNPNKRVFMSSCNWIHRKTSANCFVRISTSYSLNFVLITFRLLSETNCLSFVSVFRKRKQSMQWGVTNETIVAIIHTIIVTINERIITAFTLWITGCVHTLHTFITHSLFAIHFQCIAINRHLFRNTFPKLFQHFARN